MEMSYADFPASTATAEGMRTIDADLDGRNVFVQLDIEYATKDGRALHLIVVQPSKDGSIVDPELIAAERFPLIAYVQGSGWQEQALGACLEPLSAFARRGYVVAIIEYRPSSVARFPAQINDTVTAMRWLLDHADDFQIDPARVAVWGDSSGGHTALMTVVTAGEPDFSDESDAPPLPIACCVDFYGPVALDRMDDEPSAVRHNIPGSPESMLLGVDDLLTAPDLVRAADPRSYVSPGRSLPPIFIAHGDRDRIVPFQQSVLMYESLRAADQEVELIRVRGAGHGGPGFWTSELMDLVGGFLAAHLPSN